MTTAHARTPASERDERLCEVFGREARLYFGNVEWEDVRPKAAAYWEKLRRAGEPGWSEVEDLVERAFRAASGLEEPRPGAATAPGEHAR